jgi:hypothetical protein
LNRRQRRDFTRATPFFFNLAKKNLLGDEFMLEEKIVSCLTAGALTTGLRVKVNMFRSFYVVDGSRCF